MGTLEGDGGYTERIKVRLTEAQDLFLESLVAEGVVESKSEVVREGVNLIFAMNNQEALVLEKEEAEGVLGIAATHDVDPGDAAKFAVYLYTKVRNIDEDAIEQAWDDYLAKF